MSAEKNLSLDFYKYLCQKISYEDEVKVRRLTYIIDDLGITSNKRAKITSGSKGEGQHLKGSDYDLMFIDSLFKVYESERDVVPESGLCIPLVMETEDTHPGFTQLRILDKHNLTFKPKFIQKRFLGGTISSELYRRYYLGLISNHLSEKRNSDCKIHGPCISNLEETQDFAWCLKCDKWISQAQPWIMRTTWPPPDLISEIISCGVLYVPIGYKGSSNECLQWRMSFSVAEKILIFSFNHIQLLCYALLKILVKEIVEKHEDSENVLCLYFVKTLMFWLSEESDPLIWIPDNIIPCFMACLKRLIYCVEYSTLLHYFIPDNNLFYLRFNVDQKVKMTSILKNLLENGIYCFARSETLFDIIGLPLNATEPSISRCVATLHEIISNTFTLLNRPLILLYHFLHQASTSISKSIFFEMLTIAHQILPEIPQQQAIPNNKHKYYKYKHELSHLMIGTNSDAISGWLVLASFFYIHENYLLSIDIINHALRKCTNEKMYPWRIGLDQIQKDLLHLLKQTKICTISKALTVNYLQFNRNSHIGPQELQLNRKEEGTPFHPIVFAHFLNFLCHYHLHEIRSCNQSLGHLIQTVWQHLTTKHRSVNITMVCTCVGILNEMNGHTHSARKWFNIATQIDEYNLRRAEMRLSNCNID